MAAQNLQAGVGVDALALLADQVVRPIADNTQQRTLALQHLSTQLSALQAAVASGTIAKEPLTGHPNQHLKVLDKCSQKVALDMRARIQKRITALGHHDDTAKKYPEGKLQKLFQTEAEHAWQWPAEYKLFVDATGCEAPAAPAEGDQAMVTQEGYDVKQAWLKLRKHHAWQCQAFLRAHSLALVQKLTGLLEPKNLEKENKAAVVTFYAPKESNNYTQPEKEYFMQKVLGFVWLARRQLLSISGHAKKVFEEAVAKRVQALQEAHALYHAADLRTLIALGKLNVNDRRSYKEGSLMDYSCNHTPTDDVLDRLVRGIKDKRFPAFTAQNRAASALRPATRPTTPPRRRTPSRTTTSSKRPALDGQPERSNSLRTRTNKTPPPPRPTRGRSGSRGRSQDCNKQNKQRTPSAERQGSRPRPSSQENTYTL
eukprot:TRINITY_DN14350_c0_g1_i1.p1 TRINITY_DN14350_c0_g1~~TRINITY_DN14350_c0_g1_i1.p1  ORF type:complete len:428 (+),score=66.28 TRINITY_DN14350_c0_g1_i1:254-1537(+)